ncbi:uncharacterized protein RJT21DRAFT_123403 [Scheffersomyces amazonensis]|uniref:uncharacterized protein n=1 Tax=Scheffersomyces amazonensis TaxID=1078765 RepID=UPI00315D6AFC
MPVKAIARTSIARNGVGAFVPSCHRVSIQYCNWGGSSTGLRQALKTGKIDKFAGETQYIFYEVTKKPGHPILKFHYSNDTVQEVSVANLKAEEILDKLDHYSQRSGNKLIKFNHKVMSVNDSVRGIWSPLHLPKTHRHKI